MILYSGNKSDKHEFGTGFYISRHNMDNVLDFEPINERICKIRIKLKYYNLTLISTHAPTEDKDEVVKEDFDNCLEKTCDAIPNYDMKIILGDFNAKVGKETYLHPACGGHSLHNETNDNGKRMVNFALGRDLAVTGTWFQHKDIYKITWRSSDNKICNQIDHILVDRRHCTNVCDVRSMRGAEIESDHFLVRAKIRLKIKKIEKTKKSEIKKWDINKLNKKEVKKECSKEVTANIQRAQL